MTREEAEALALSMPRIAALIRFRNHVVDVEWSGLDVLLPDGSRHGIGNKEAIAVARKALLDTLDRQISEEAASGS